MTTLPDQPGAVTLREYVEVNFKLRDQRFEDYKEASEKREALAQRNTEGKLEKLNELRQEVTKDRALYVTRAEQGAKGEAVEARLALLEKFQSKLLGIGIVLVIVSGAIGALIMRMVH